MFKSNSFISGVDEIPSNWIFEYYLGTEPLSGQRVRLKSIFNQDDKTPSMFVYYDDVERAYKFKCFSTGKSGHGANLVMFLKNLPYKEACDLIESDYKKFLLSGNVPKGIVFNKEIWQVCKYVKRQFTQNDAKYWSAYNISSDLLNKWNIHALESYSMCNNERSFEVRNSNTYGYFNKFDELYKIYQPLIRDRKFIKVADYVQGADQLEGHNNLVIASSMKDGLALKSLGVKLDFIAPDSENTLLSPKLIKELKKNYKAICTILDRDKAGVKAMQDYQERYKIPFAYLQYEKDMADIVKLRGKNEATILILPPLHKALEKYGMGL